MNLLVAVVAGVGAFVLAVVLLSALGSIGPIESALCAGVGFATSILVVRQRRAADKASR